MRRILCALLVVALLATAVVAAAGCGSGKAKADANSMAVRHLFSLDGFDLRAGRPYRISFAVDAPALRIVAATGRASGIVGWAMAISKNPLSSYADSAPNARILVKARSGPKAGIVLAQAKADAKGRFRVSLAPGSYLVYGPDQSVRAASVTVTAGHFTKVQVVTNTMSD